MTPARGGSGSLGGLDRREDELVREEWNQLCFDAVGDVIQVIALVDLKLVGNVIAGQNAVEIARVLGDSIITVADIDGDAVQLAQIA